jgi:hypothetical protein
MRYAASTYVVVAALLCVSASSQILRLEELNTEQIKALDRTKTVVIIPGGILEQHEEVIS